MDFHSLTLIICYSFPLMKGQGVTSRVPGFSFAVYCCFGRKGTSLALFIQLHQQKLPPDPSFLATLRDPGKCKEDLIEENFTLRVWQERG